MTKGRWVALIALVAVSAGIILVAVRHFTVSTGAARVVEQTRGAPGREDARGWINETTAPSKGPKDWEPAVAADPSSDYVYILSTNVAGPPWKLRLRISSDGGHRFSSPVPFFGSFDPVIETDANGNVYAAWCARTTKVWFSRSTDHGQTWSDPLRLFGKGLPLYQDKPILAVSDDGKDVYVGVNTYYSPNHNYQVSSHDYGQTWFMPVRTDPVGSDTWYSAWGATVLPNGDVLFVDRASAQYGGGADDLVLIRSNDGGVTWTEQVLEHSARSKPCPGPCPQWWTEALPSIARNGDGDLLLIYTAPPAAREAPRLFVRRSSNNGATWTDPVAISPPNGGVTLHPQSAGGVGGRFAVAWVENRQGTQRFNTYESDSFDSGVTWTKPTRISNLGYGASYKNRDGYVCTYGDYFGLDITNDQKAFAAWGEGYGDIHAHHYNQRPAGAIWFSVQK